MRLCIATHSEKAHNGIRTPPAKRHLFTARLYAGPVSLQRFEENAGASNSSLLRFEGNALLNVERSTAAVRIT